MASQSATTGTSTHALQPQKVTAEPMPVTSAEKSSKTGPQGMPEEYSGREITDPDNIEMKHAGEPKSLAV